MSDTTKFLLVILAMIIAVWLLFLLYSLNLIYQNTRNVTDDGKLDKYIEDIFSQEGNSWHTEDFTCYNILEFIQEPNEDQLKNLNWIPERFQLLNLRFEFQTNLFLFDGKGIDNKNVPYQIKEGSIGEFHSVKFKKLYDRKILMSILKDKMPAKDELDKIVKKAFSLYDTDKSGYLEREEIKKMFNDVVGDRKIFSDEFGKFMARISGSRMTEEQLDESIKKIDENGDGKFSFEEIYKIIWDKIWETKKSEIQTNLNKAYYGGNIKRIGRKLCIEN